MIAFVRKSGLGLFKVAVGPFVGLGRGVAAGGQAAWWAHVVLLLAVLGNLWWLNGYLGLDHVVHAPSQLLRQFWLPAVFLMGYAAAVLAFFTWRLLAEPDAVSPFPEIDRAWRQGIEAMSLSGVAFHEKPLVLILGHPGAESGDLVAALDLNPTVGPVPSESNAMIRLLADDDAVYLIAHQTSLLSACADRLRQERVTRRSRVASRQVATAAVEQKMPVALRVGTATETAEIGGPQAVAAVVPNLDQLDASEDPATADAVREAARLPLLDTDRAAVAEARLAHLVQLVARHREPVLPIDAIAVVVPCDATEDDRRAQEVADALRHDLETVDAVAGVRCPVLAVGSELQNVEGCGRLLHALSADRKRRHLGVNLPADARRSEVALRESIDSLTQTLTPALCQRLLEVENNNSRFDENAELFRFQSAIARRSHHLADLLSHGLSDADGGGWPLTGCYLVATGDPVGGSQAFGTGVLATLTDASGDADWTPAARQRDTRRNQAVAAGYASLAAASFLVVCLLVV